MTEPATRSRIAIGFIGLAVVTHVWLAWSARDPGIMTGQDDAQYLILGQSIRAGGYHELFRVDRPVHALYPPGYPAVLAVWGAVVGDRYDGLVALSVAFGAASLLLLGLTLRRLVEPALAVAATWLLAINTDVVSSSGSISSEAPFIFFSMASLALARGDSRRILWLAGLAALLAALTRVVGVVLLGAIALHWVLARRGKATGWLLVATLLTVGAWLAWTAAAPDQHEGVSYARDLVAGVAASQGVEPLPGRLLSNTVYYAKRLAWTVALPSVRGTVIDNVIATGVLAATAMAGLVTLLGRWRPASLYGLGYAGLLVVWTWPITRYLVPIEFVLVPAIVLGAAALAARVRPTWSVAAALGVALGLGGLATVRTADLVASRVGCDRSGDMPPANCLSSAQARFFDALRYITRELPSEAVLLSAKYATLYYYTGRTTVSYRGTLAQDSASMVPFLRGQRVTHVLLGRLHISEKRDLAPRLRAACRNLAVERAFGEATFLFRLETATPVDADRACSTIDDYLRQTADDDFGEFTPGR